jgi:dihydrofolate reductase
MRKVILQEFVTLDGLAAGPNDSVDFVPASTQGDQSFGQEQLTLMDAIDTILLGGVTYRMFAEFWPKVTEGEEKPFADKLNSTPKIVFSQTLDRAPWGTWDEARIVKNSAVNEVAKLKRQSGKDMIIWGSISLAQSLINDWTDRRVSTGGLSCRAGDWEATLWRQGRTDRHETAERKRRWISEQCH